MGRSLFVAPRPLLVRTATGPLGKRSRARWCCCASASDQPAVVTIFGLGNPGAEYDGTRHNVGFMFLDFYARRHNAAPFSRDKALKAQTTTVMVSPANPKVLLVKPLTYMNKSEESLRPALKMLGPKGFHPSLHLIAVVDDIALAVGRLRARPAGSSGGHNGLKSLGRVVSSVKPPPSSSGVLSEKTKREAGPPANHFARLRLGVGGVDEGHDMADYVLGKFGRSDRELLEKQVFWDAAEMLDEWVRSRDFNKMNGVVQRSSGN